MATKKEIFSSKVVKEYLLDFVGDAGYRVAKALPVTRAKSEYDVASSVKMNINQLRSVLYKFYSKNLVFYHRIRDAQKGWYIYHWKFFPDKLIELIIKEKEQLLKVLQDEFNDASGKQFYVCNSCRQKHDFERAFNNNFICQKCRSNLKLLETKQSATKIKSEANKLKRDAKKLKKLMK